MNKPIDNPFSVETPEQMTASEINELYVPVPQAELLLNTRHIFLHGHRGCGKSMILRRMSPDCQMLLQKCSFDELDFLGVYLSIKKTGLDVVEYELLNNEAVGIMFAEHALICHLASALFQEVLANCNSIKSSQATREVYELITTFLFNVMEVSGLDKKHHPIIRQNSTLEYMLKSVIYVFDQSFRMQNSYFKRKITYLVNLDINYDGPLYGFHDLFVPLVEKMKLFSFLPSGPVYFLIDDADNLNLLQTQVLNTWVSYRTYKSISLKISTQMRYKTYSTVSGIKIENPHDYSEVYESSVHIIKNKEHNYLEWVKEIVKKRLYSYYGEHIDPECFFATDVKQENAIQKIGDEYRAAWTKEKGGSRPSEDAYRNARPEYMKRISGNSKGGSKYLYSGFNQLVHMSSGIIRLFLDPASTMFAIQSTFDCEKKVTSISPSIQNKVLREESDYLLFLDFDKKLKDQNLQDLNNKNDLVSLRNLIITIGALFRKLLLDSSRSERRYFSFAISDYENMTSELREILDLGVQEGYMYESYIGSKEKSGRTKLYILNRRLAPYFKLDPIGFSGYKFITCYFLLTAMAKPKTIINQLDKNGVDALINQSNQLSLI